MAVDMSMLLVKNHRETLKQQLEQLITKHFLESNNHGCRHVHAAG